MADNITLNLGAGGAVVGSDDIAGINFQRIKLIHGADGVNDGDVSTINPLPVRVQDNDRTSLTFSAVAAASGTTTTETAITLVKSTGFGIATSSAASHLITSGKRFRITSMLFAARGHATATIQSTTFNVRSNAAGATGTTSNILLSARCATPATASAWDRVLFNFGETGPEILGDGTQTFGVTAAATFTTNAPTWDVQITGYEF